LCIVGVGHRGISIVDAVMSDRAAYMGTSCAASISASPGSAAVSGARGAICLQQGH